MTPFDKRTLTRTVAPLFEFSQRHLRRIRRKLFIWCTCLVLIVVLYNYFSILIPDGQITLGENKIDLNLITILVNSVMAGAAASLFVVILSDYTINGAFPRRDGILYVEQHEIEGIMRDTLSINSRHVFFGNSGHFTVAQTIPKMIAAKDGSSRNISCRLIIDDIRSEQLAEQYSIDHQGRRSTKGMSVENLKMRFIAKGLATYGSLCRKAQKYGAGYNFSLAFHKNVGAIRCEQFDEFVLLTHGDDRGAVIVGSQNPFYDFFSRQLDSLYNSSESLQFDYSKLRRLATTHPDDMDLFNHFLSTYMPDSRLIADNAARSEVLDLAAAFMKRPEHEY